MFPIPQFSHSRSFLCAALFAASMIPIVGRSSVIVSDNFTSAAYSAGTANSGGTRSIVSTLNYYSTNTAASGGPALITTDSSAPLAGNALQLSGWANNSIAVASFTTVNLAVNEYITFSLDYRSTVGTTGRVFLGLYNDGGTPLSENYYGNLTAGSELDGDKGYNFSKTLSSSANDLTIYSESMSSFKTFQFQQNNGNLLQTASSGISGSDTTVHSVSLTITRLSNGNLTISGVYDGVSTSTTVLAGAVLTTSFNELAFTGYGSASNFDNILITTGVVPEPSTIPTVIGCLALLVIFRRYRCVTLK